MNCPKCNGPMWDNRQNKTSPRAPDFRCQDKNCDGVIWPLKGQNGQQQQRPASPKTADPKPLGRIYVECLAVAQRALTYVLSDTPIPPDVLVAAAATLFIQAARDPGRPIASPKKAPPPPPPPVPPEEMPLPLRDPYEDSYEDGLPF